MSAQAPDHKSMELSDILDLVLLAAVWGASFLFTRVAAPEFGPVPLIELRVTIAALFLLPLLLRKKKAASLKDHAGPLLLTGIVNSAVPFSLFAYAVLSLTAGFTSILNATSPFFTAIIGWFWLKNRLTASRLAGLAVGFLGVVVLVWGKASFKSGGAGPAVLAATLGAFLYGVSANYTKKRLTGVDSLAIATGSQIGAAIFLLPFALWAAPHSMPSSRAWLALLGSGVVSTAVAYILYFRLMANVGATRAVASTFLIPCFGMLWGALFLKEPVTANMLAGTAIILLGTALTNGLIKGRRPAAAVLVQQ